MEPWKQRIREELDKLKDPPKNLDRMLEAAGIHNYPVSWSVARQYAQECLAGGRRKKKKPKVSGHPWSVRS